MVRLPVQIEPTKMKCFVAVTLFIASITTLVVGAGLTGGNFKTDENDPNLKTAKELIEEYMINNVVGKNDDIKLSRFKCTTQVVAGLLLNCKYKTSINKGKKEDWSAGVWFPPGDTEPRFGTGRTPSKVEYI